MTDDGKGLGDWITAEVECKQDASYCLLKWMLLVNSGFWWRLLSKVKLHCKTVRSRVRV